MAGGVANCREEKPVHVYAVSGDSRAQLDPFARHTGSTRNVQRPRAHSTSPVGGDECGKRPEGTARWRLYVSNAPADSVLLIALAVGDLSFKALSSRTGVYAEPSVVDKAAQEFSDTEKMVQATENSMGHTGGNAMTCWCCHQAFPLAEWRIPGLPF